MSEHMVRWIAFHLPKRLVCWCAIRLGAYASTGQYEDTVVPELTFLDALRRWENGRSHTLDYSRFATSFDPHSSRG